MRTLSAHAPSAASGVSAVLGVQPLRTPRNQVERDLQNPCRNRNYGKGLLMCPL